MKHARKDYDRIQDPEHQIPEDEPVFLLRAQDRTAAETVRHWVILQLMLPDSDKQAVGFAIAQAEKMDAWPKKKTADV